MNGTSSEKQRSVQLLVRGHKGTHTRARCLEGLALGPRLVSGASVRTTSTLVGPGIWCCFKYVPASRWNTTEVSRIRTHYY